MKSIVIVAEQYGWHRKVFDVQNAFLSGKFVHAVIVEIPKYILRRCLPTKQHDPIGKESIRPERHGPDLAGIGKRQLAKDIVKRITKRVMCPH